MSLLNVMPFHSNLLTNYIIILRISSCFLAGLRLLVTSFNMTKKKWIESQEFFVGQNGTIGIYPKPWDLVVKPPLPAA